jgi:hypothetical protein
MGKILQPQKVENVGSFRDIYKLQREEESEKEEMRVILCAKG